MLFSIQFVLVTHDGSHGFSYFYLSLYQQKTIFLKISGLDSVSDASLLINIHGLAEEMPACVWLAG